MGLLDRIKGKKPQVDWNNACVAEPKFYRNAGGEPFGAIALTEGTETVLPKNPQTEYRVDGKPVAEWRLVLVSTSKQAIIGDTDYSAALRLLSKDALDSNQNAILVRGRSLAELEALK